MTEYNTFCDEVLRYIPRATMAEQEQIRQELMNHLEDHREILLAHGAQEEAERRSIESMGEPAEIGKAWNKQLSPLWLWMGRICKVAFCLLLLFNIPMVVFQLTGVWDNIQARKSLSVGARTPDGVEVFWHQEPEIVQEFGAHVIRLYRVELGTVTDEPGENYCALIYTLSYPENPLHNALDTNILMDMRCNGKETAGGGGGGSNPGYTLWCCEVNVEKNTPTVQLELEYLGNRFFAEVPLDWGGVP